MTIIEAQIPDTDHQVYATEELDGFDGSTVATIERFPSVAIKSALKQNKMSIHNGLAEIDIQDFYDRLGEAGEIFAQGQVGPGEASRSEYVEQVSRITGLPKSSIDDSADIIEHCLKNIESIIEHYVPNGDVTVLDEKYYRSNSYSKTDLSTIDLIFSKMRRTVQPTEMVTVGYVPKGQNLGVVSPSNHPAVMTLALIAYATKYPLAVRPSDGEPFTPARLIAALHEANVPRSSLVFLPGDRDVGEKVLSQSDLGIGFGGPRLQKQYSNIQSVKIHGPGNSKIVIDEGWEDDDHVYDLLEEAMLRDGGRGCINMSQIVTTGDASIIADRLANRVANIKVRSPLSADAKIPAFVDGDRARQLHEQIDQELQRSAAKDTTDEYRDGDRLAVRDQVSYLRPTVIELAKTDSSLFCEYPFQYATVSSVSREDLKSVVGGSLTVSVFTDAESLVTDLLLEPSIGKVYAGGETTCDMDLREPHEGYITDFLFKRKAYRPP